MFRPVPQRPLRTGAVLLGAAALAAGGCSNFTDGERGRELPASGAPYQSDRARAALEVPPDLSREGIRDAYPIPGASSSGAEKGRDAREVLPQAPDMRVERDGRLRRLVVEAEPSDLWEDVREFWRSQGFRIDLDSPETGTMETGWAEKRVDLPVGQVRRVLERFKRFAYQYSVRDRFRTRFERGAEPETTEIHVAHRGAHEVERGDGYAWSPRPSDADLEAEMLGRLMLFLGRDEASAESSVASPEVVRPVPGVEMVSAPAGGRHVLLGEGFDRAWRLTALALDRAGFTVEDRDRSQGVFFVRYIDPEFSAGRKKRSWASRLAFWSRPGDERPENTEFRIFLEEDGEDRNRTRIVVRDGEGRPAAGETADRILDVLAEQLR